MHAENKCSSRQTIICVAEVLNAIFDWVLNLDRLCGWFWNAKIIGHLHKGSKYFWNDYELTMSFVAASQLDMNITYLSQP